MRRLILRGIDRSQIIGALIGCLFGFTVLLSGFQLYFDLKPVLGGDSGIWDPNFYIVNKKVSMLNEFSEGGSSFDREEIRELREKDFVKDLAPFSSSEFRIRASTSKREKVPGFKTHMFFESVPNDFLDIDTGEWHWNEEKEFLPIVIPSHYIALYNFGFAQSQGLPQISENMASQVSFDIHIEGQGKSKTFKSRLVAFSDRINSILVPQDFMDWANERFGEKESVPPSRLIIACEDGNASRLFHYIDEENYEVQGGDRKAGKLMGLLNTGVTIVSITAGIIIVLAAWLLIVSFRLLIIKNKETIQKLFLIGQELSGIRDLYVRLMMLFSTGVLLASFLIMLLLRYFYIDLFNAAGFEMEGWFSLWTLFIAVLALALINGVNKLLLGLQLKRIVE